MVVQYPHYLFAVLAGSESAQDEEGNWTESGQSRQLIARCREETNGHGTKLALGGGTFHLFQSLVQLPKGAQRLGVGTKVSVCNDSAGVDVRISGTVVKFDQGQLHSRMWI